MTRSPTDTRRAQAWGSERLLTGGSSLRHLLITTTSPPPQRLCHRGTSQHGRWRCAEPLYAWSPTRDSIVPRGCQTVHACLSATSRRVGADAAKQSCLRDVAVRLACGLDLW